MRFYYLVLSSYTLCSSVPPNPRLVAIMIANFIVEIRRSWHDSTISFSYHLKMPHVRHVPPYSVPIIALMSGTYSPNHSGLARQFV